MSGGSREAVSYGLALGGTALPVVVGAWMLDRRQPTLGLDLILLGILTGPSLGQYYNRAYWPGTIGLLARGAGEALIVQSVFTSFDWGGDGDAEAYSKLAGFGFFLLIAGTTYSLVDTHFAVQRIRQGSERWIRMGSRFQLCAWTSGTRHEGVDAFLKATQTAAAGSSMRF
jgi:hypothetical protein